jgi:hypothetical protein
MAAGKKFATRPRIPPRYDFFFLVFTLV